MVVGLGNPGAAYARSRHNLGFRVLDLLAEKLDPGGGAVRFRKRRFGAKVSEGVSGDCKVILVKPWRFMNLSGPVVESAAGYYGMSPDELIVVLDDMALEPGRLRLRAAGSAGGHNGLADVLDSLGTESVARCRLGIGRRGGPRAVRYVLSDVPAGQRETVERMVGRAVEAVLCWVRHGIEKAMNEFNRPDSDGPEKDDNV
jgi:PTH1 family peptidyl-tRNA hydrolase